MYICKCMHIWLCMFTYTHIYLHMYIHAYTCIRKTMQRFWLVFLGENETLRRLKDLSPKSTQDMHAERCTVVSQAVAIVFTKSRSQYFKCC